MSDRIGLGLSSISVSEHRPTPWERMRKIAVLAVVFVLLGIFFYFLTAQVQMGTAHVTNTDAGWSPASTP